MTFNFPPFICCERRKQSELEKDRFCGEIVLQRSVSAEVRTCIFILIPVSSPTLNTQYYTCEIEMRTVERAIYQVFYCANFPTSLHHSPKVKANYHIIADPIEGYLLKVHLLAYSFSVIIGKILILLGSTAVS